MKAFVRIDAARQDVKLQEVPIPIIKEDEVLIKVKAFGAGIHDRYYIPSDAEFPYVIGSEGAGVITEIGNQVKDFAVGDAVIFSSALQPQGGSWAEYTAAKQSSLIPLPKELTFAQGATVPVACTTSLECMRELNLKEGDKLFIAGASGAIGTMIIQLAKQKGVHVSGSASEKNHTYMESLGAEKTVDYHDADWINQVIEWSNGGVDAALAIQPGTEIDSIKVVKNHGKLLMVSGYNSTLKPERDIEPRQMGHREETQLKVIELVNKIAEGKIKIVIEKEYSFENALEALEKTETRHARGKLVVKL